MSYVAAAAMLTIAPLKFFFTRRGYRHKGNDPPRGERTDAFSPLKEFIKVQPTTFTLSLVTRSKAGTALLLFKVRRDLLLKPLKILQISRDAQISRRCREICCKIHGSGVDFAECILDI